MTRILLVAITSAVLFASGCDPSPEGQIDFTSQGSLAVEHSIRWDHQSHEWDVRVDCELYGSFAEETLHISAYDNTFADGLTIDLRIQEFSGNGDYTRTENQPQSTLQLTLLDTVSDTWVLDTRDGGYCNYSIESKGRVGTFSCLDVTGMVDQTAMAFDDVTMEGSWTCTGLYLGSDNDSRYDSGYGRDDDEDHLDDDSDW